VDGQEHVVQLPNGRSFQLRNGFFIARFGDVHDGPRPALLAEDVFQPLGVQPERVDLPGHRFGLEGDEDPHVVADRHRQR
jgi:hypothetical protein